MRSNRMDINHAKHVFFVLLAFSIARPVMAFTDYWIYGHQKKPFEVLIGAGSEKVRCVLVGFTGICPEPNLGISGICPNPRGGIIESKCLYYSGLPSKRLFIGLASDVDEKLTQSHKPPHFVGPGACLEVHGDGIAQLHQGCLRAAQSEREWMINWRSAGPSNWKATIPVTLANIAGSSMWLIETNFPECRLWNCHTTEISGIGPFTCIGVCKPLAFLDECLFLTIGVDDPVASTYAYGMLAIATQRKQRSVPHDWWRNWGKKSGRDKNIRLDIFDFSTYCSDSFAKLAELTDPAYLDYVWGLVTREQPQVVSNAAVSQPTTSLLAEMPKSFLDFDGTFTSKR